jgi:hypothetical protein
MNVTKRGALTHGACGDQQNDDGGSHEADEGARDGMPERTADDRAEEQQDRLRTREADIEAGLQTEFAQTVRGADVNRIKRVHERNRRDQAEQRNVLGRFHEAGNHRRRQQEDSRDGQAQHDLHF